MPDREHAARRHRHGPALKLRVTTFAGAFANPDASRLRSTEVGAAVVRPRLMAASARA